MRHWPCLSMICCSGSTRNSTLSGGECSTFMTTLNTDKFLQHEFQEYSCSMDFPFHTLLFPGCRHVRQLHRDPHHRLILSIQQIYRVSRAHRKQSLEFRFIRPLHGIFRTAIRCRSDDAHRCPLGTHISWCVILNTRTPRTC